jgi:hypothetical protein
LFGLLIFVLRIIKMYPYELFNRKYPGRDWIEDRQDENGNYENECIICKKLFIGHKRRVVCFKCYKENKNV